MALQWESTVQIWSGYSVGLRELLGRYITLEKYSDGYREGNFN